MKYALSTRGPKCQGGIDFRQKLEECQALEESLQIERIFPQKCILSSVQFCVGVPGGVEMKYPPSSRMYHFSYENVNINVFCIRKASMGSYFSHLAGHPSKQIRMGM